MAFERELAVALEAAKLAGEFLLEEYRRFQAIPDAPASISTEADRQSQEIILARLLRDYPQDAYCAEEGTQTLTGLNQSGPRLWVIDPIDGTRGFARKNGEFSVMIGLAFNNAPVVGVVLEPARNRLTYARQGSGCWTQNGFDQTALPCQVTSVGSLADATLTQTHSRAPKSPNAVVRAVNPKRVVESYSAGVKMALVARGQADLYVNTYQAFSDWDICAGHVLVEEAGGVVTGLHGESISYGLPGAAQRAGLLASNRALHPEAVRALVGISTDG
jgi:3'(2'), 5'-bisphosphate nucleotidase